MILDGYAILQAVLFTLVAGLATIPALRRLLGHEGEVTCLGWFGPDPHLPSPTGVTPLMAAAQTDALDSAHFLLSKGARVNADTWQTNGAPKLVHDGRSALMYAASNGSFAMIEALLKAGADIFQTDIRGRRALDYLLGFGPTPPNSRLTPTQRADAVALLF